MGYLSDLTDAEWALIKRHFQPRNQRGSISRRPHKQIVEAIVYVVKPCFRGSCHPMIFPIGKRLTILSPGGVSAASGNQRGIG